MHGHGLGSLLSAESLLGRFKGQPLENIKVKVDEAPSWERWRRESDAKLRKEKKTRELKREARNVMIKRGLRLPPGWDNSEDFISSDMEHDTEVDELESALIAHEKAQVDRFKRLARKGAFRANVIAKGCKVPTSWIYLKDESSGQQNEPNRLVWMLPKF